MKDTNLKRILIKRLCDISNYGEYMPISFDSFLESYIDEPISFIEEILEMRRQEKVNSLIRLTQSNKITYYRAYCKNFKIKNYSVMNFEQLKEALTDEINRQINFINNVLNTQTYEPPPLN